MIGSSVPTVLCRRLCDSRLAALRPTHRSFQLEVRFVNLRFLYGRLSCSTILAVPMDESYRSGNAQAIGNTLETRFRAGRRLPC